VGYIKYSIIALIGWGIWAIGTKLLTRSLNVTSTTFWVSFWSILILLVFIAIKRNLIIDHHAFYALPVGLASLIAILAFYKALKIGPSTVVLPLTNLYVILPVLFGFIILREAITLTRMIGIGLAIAATILLSL
jgi:transporter family protein